MHTYLQNFLIRISLVLMASAIVAYMVHDLLHSPVSIPNPPAVLTRQIPKLPETEKALHNAQQIHSILQSSFEPAERETLDVELFPLKENDVFSLVQVEPTLIMTSEKNNFVVINNMIYKQGDVLPDGRKIALIRSEGLFLSAGTNKQFIPWKNPKQVLLVQESPAKAEKENALPPRASEVPKETQNADPAMTSEEIEALLKKFQTDGIKKN
ncbi:hypothetical protein [Desulfoplanes sp.]